MDDRVNAMVCEYGRDLCIVADVALHETMPRVAGNRVEVLEISGIRELVERCDLDIRAARQRIADERRSDEPGTAGDKKLHEQFSVKCYGFAGVFEPTYPAEVNFQVSSLPHECQLQL